MRRLVLMLVIVAVCIARPAWPDDRPPGAGAPGAAAAPANAFNVQFTGGRLPDQKQRGSAPVLFLPVQLDAHGTAAGTDNYGRPLQARPPQ